MVVGVDGEVGGDGFRVGHYNTASASTRTGAAARDRPTGEDAAGGRSSGQSDRSIGGIVFGTITTTVNTCRVTRDGTLTRFDDCESGCRLSLHIDSYAG